MYRPEGFKNPYEPDGEETEEYLDHGLRDQGVYEAGADAMLGGLRKEGRIIINWGGDDDPEIHRNGHLVFIPEEE